MATGLWHGAAWNFIVWGIYNDLFLIIERIKLKEILDRNRFKFLNHIYTMLIVIVGWVLFRADGLKNAILYLKVMFIPNGTQSYFYLTKIINLRNVIIIIIAMIFSGIFQSISKKSKISCKVKEFYSKYLEIFVILILMAICIMMLASSTYNPFIYFRF